MRDLGAEAYASYVTMCKEVWHCPALERSAYERQTRHIPKDVVNADIVLMNNNRKKDA